MQIEIEVSLTEKYATLSTTTLKIDSDVLDKPSLAQLAGDLVISACARAEKKVAEQMEAKPE